jgi:hypothetical protein
MLLLVVTHGIRPAANKNGQEEIARTAKSLAGLAAIASTKQIRVPCYVPALCIALHTS